MRDLLHLWELGFQKYQPGVQFEDRLKGTVSAMGGLYGGDADLAFMGREIWPVERMAFIQSMGYEPQYVEVAIGSYDVPTKADALVIFVHKDNPLQGLTLEQLDEIFGAEHRRGQANVRTWGELGLKGEWSTHAIDLYGYRLDNAAAIFFSSVVMKGSLKWNPTIGEFANEERPDGTRIDAGQQILEALAKDRYGIAISNPHYAGSKVKWVALQSGDGAEVEPTRENVATGAYPLARAVYICFKRARGSAVDSLVLEFLHYVLSPAGQNAVRDEGAYLPLPKLVDERELRKLGAETTSSSH